MRDRAANLYFVEAIRWPGNRILGAVRREDRESTTWGRGQSIVLQWTDHSLAIVTLYQGLPFAVIQDVIVNSDVKDIRLSRREFAAFEITAGKPVDDCRAFGTFGLEPIRDARNPGSYNHLAIVQPESRSGVVMAWLTHERASGVLFYDREPGDDSVRVTARQDYGQLRLRPSDPAPSESLLVGYFADARLGLEAYAEAARDYYKIQLPPQPSVYCTWYHAGASNERQIREQAEFAARQLKPFGFGVIQIDDKWQDGISRDGPRRIFTRHRPDGPFPSGMKATADDIKSRGLTPGLWYMPFAATSYDPYYADRPQLFATKDGKPFEVRWGGTCLDLTNPDAQELVRARTQTICNDWGYRYLKTDGMWTGMATAIAYINDGYKEDNLGEATLGNADMTHVEAYRTGLRIVRQTAGKEVFILGCNLAQNMRILGPSIGFVDAMRVGPDNKPTWSQMTRGPSSGSNLYFLHGRVWYNDPDPVYVRPQVPLHQAQALLSWVTLSGQLHANSYYYADLPPERFDLLKRAIPSHGLLPRPVDLFDERTPRIWLLEDARRETPFYLLGLFNWDAEKSAHIDQSFKRIGLPPGDRYITFDYWDDKFGINEGDAVHMMIDAASCRILALRPMAERPQLISTSRHITQGVVDVISESWDADSKSLSGVSRVVAGDPYELRIARAASSDWRLVETTVGEAVNASIKLVSEEAAGWRVRIDSPTNQELHWVVRFE
ncbi:MAG TPA: hypothetical protein VJ828_07095 [Lacipirellulaceae bacterium]|nr:hypothetical protein [Lacipirellulaceae bacterium]